MDIEIIKKQMREKRKNYYNHGNKLVSEELPKMFPFITKIMILAIILLAALIYTKSSTTNKQMLYDVLFKENFSFAPINNLYNKYLGGILPFKDLLKDSQPVFKENLVFSESNIYKDGVSLSVGQSYLVPALASGIVVFIGEKDDYGKTIIVQQIDGVDAWYGNLENISVKMYDYIDGGSLLGETVDDKLYMVFKKEGKVIDYKEYIQ